MSPTPSARSVAQIARVLAILDRYADQHHALSELAELAGLSRFYLSRTFRAVVGMSLRDYLRDLKLRRAIELLRICARDTKQSVVKRPVLAFRRRRMVTRSIWPCDITRRPIVSTWARCFAVTRVFRRTRLMVSNAVRAVNPWMA